MVCPRACSSTTAGRSARRPGWGRSSASVFIRAPRRCSSHPGEPWRNGTIEHFNDTFDKRFFRTERFSGLEHLVARAGAFERFHNAHHRYSATGGLTPEQTSASEPRAPRALAELPVSWPERGKVEFIRFIRSDHKLRILGRAIAMPDGSAYQYVTATLDLALPPERNLLVANDQGELLTTAKLSIPGS